MQLVFYRELTKRVWFAAKQSRELNTKLRCVVNYTVSQKKCANFDKL